uniref:Methyltransferase type 11 domain-containing protein n=1 Tax=Zooxanthella nutricula TaxID=1333877 RepID=A0A7S2JT38_9DINO|eukprot:CAMPEP_0198519280 /NCGR_PEP_ID=MMETSP1462-20131121/19622_1 /TAXON_ID=1333877 /ORGANISM="Brandtodinium nutriculum, Strain RCC3387" /LENGTH=294 /DNA_ID=CAMNT_0044248887 /DNA_START=12 /DNA_END=896 /DNA_ORIENTATION=-
MAQPAEQPTRGFTAAYRNAAAADSAIIDDNDSGIKLDHRTEFAADPSMPLRERVAARIARSVQSIERPRCIDVACAVGTDLGLLVAALGEKPAELHGIDLLEKQLEVARSRLPGAIFAQGDVLDLPFPDSHFDSLQASRLLIHVPDFRKAIDEMLRVMKPGALGVLCEADIGTCNILLTSDDRLQSVFAAKTKHVAKMCANDHAASDAYKYLLSHAGAVDVCMEPFSCILPDPAMMGLDFIKFEGQMLQKLVSDGTLAQADADYYLAEAQGQSAKDGNFVQLGCGPLEISFRKK